MTSTTKLADQYRGEGCTISFELFPPKTDKGMQLMERNVERLTQFGPAFFTCTYGAGGSTQTKTLDVVQRVRQATDLPVASHLTCVGLTVDQLCDYLREAKQRGADYIVALRGDPPQGSTEFQAVAGGLRYANELVELIRSEFADEFGIAVAGYPEVHQEAIDAATDLTNLKRKVDAGADVVVTQLFYDNDDFYRFRDACDQAGIHVPIVPGILPVTNFRQAERIAGLCKARIPDQLAAAMNAVEDDAEQFEIGVEHARQQTIDLLENQVAGIHYYVLNKSDAAEKMLEGLSLGKV
ncbi:methylenetetrahydrofolate reductase [NAD(P)H] [Roseiconus lacunae]|uniref:Methylenetetrahydrofolate reductase n=1 Tax=Roseiconus lacunae TaxID=2605694 RepID=A0ABT7PBS5_9BACT|nr:methylenetetrahydrofolate reductase [NAD(P)H] [Roseiconus lacunae]MCD0462046.1 methylenetetrahydrofolate reductase [NAD(P)H] [Roseiconus lacunae]MDM4013947.1 methylenetetrahydrofolate reductase [NAD(P)H] [Roseiconus lacunae]WRQ53243.1 methylenetetrahydrofolate reductase [NAD(P)H] [Stieleria sp. HD01]